MTRRGRCGPNIAWKVAAGLALDDEGIHYSVLTYWRTRLRAVGAPGADLRRGPRGRRRDRGVDGQDVAGRWTRRLLDDAVATQDTVTQLVSAIRRVRRLIPEAAAVEVARA